MFPFRGCAHVPLSFPRSDTVKKKPLHIRLGQIRYTAVTTGFNQNIPVSGAWGGQIDMKEEKNKSKNKNKNRPVS